MYSIFVSIHGFPLYIDATDLLHSLASCFSYLATRSFILCSFIAINSPGDETNEVKETEGIENFMTSPCMLIKRSQMCMLKSPGAQ